MKITAALALALLTAPLAGSLALAQPHEGGRPGGREEGRPGGREEGRVVVRPAPPARPAPPQWQAHPGGGHPHGPIVRPHQVRVLAPRMVPHGGHPWRHWEHPEFSRPAYYWDWAAVHQVTCIAEDSYGDQYPVTESVGAGFGLANMTTVEDNALDRCNAESGGDTSCYLATCTHY